MTDPAVQGSSPPAEAVAGSDRPGAGVQGEDPGGGARAAASSSRRGRRARHTVTARTKARRRAVEILFEADQRGLLVPTSRGAQETEGDTPDLGVHNASYHDASYREASRRLRSFAAQRAVHSANHTEAPAYARQVVEGVCDHLADIDEAIQTYAQGWVLMRMPAVDRAIARAATWEIVYNDDVDVPVAVDEAVTLARLLSTEESPRFLSGLLGRIGDLADTLR
ncbi:transcription antitermination factor NusB [Actinomyces sp. 2119]|uniref:Transcription antitermination protein NusB n=1 Tax=Actinomyces lilanjuaniae TaxID=2321394 RepID=A0ABM6Z3C5_9ACTO|nr:MULTISPECIES: transcription antitermination factor NusB [Actinomyces]AYD89761.1 transcription antitermination factor NusB [Actinomyces lilanjuaniae]RJF44731.1 transcription antitermination factor NusB [Actinomyces sp. 2119]